MALEPITRQEQIIAGKDLKPITRMERFLKEYGGGSGGGSGSSVQSDWNQTDSSAADFIKNKPFGDVPTGGDTLTWDGNTEGLVSNTDGGWVKVSNAITSMADFENGATISGVFDGEKQSFLIPYDAIFEDDGGIIVSGIFFINEDGIGKNIDDLVFPESGVYFPVDAGITSITIPGYTGFPGVKKMDEKYLPDSVKSGAVILHVDAQPDDTYLYRDRMSSILKDESGRVTRTELENWIALGKTIYALDFANSRYMLCVLFEGTSVITINPPKDNAWGIYNTAEYTPET